MATVTIQEAQAKLPDLIHGLTPGDEIVITEKDQPVARILSAVVPRKPRRPGTLSRSRSRSRLAPACANSASLLATPPA